MDACPSPSLRGGRPRLRAPAAGLLVAALLLGGCGDSPRPNVLLISVDTLRPDHLSLHGYPRRTSPCIDAFFRDGWVFERAYSAEAATAPSVLSILSGRYPANHGVRLLYQRIDPEVELLPDLLERAGYQTAGVVSNVVLTDEATGLAERFDEYDDFVDERESRRDVFERRAARTTDAALAWLGARREEDRPHLLWVHYIDPHGPYDPPPDKPVAFSHEGSQQIDPERMLSYQRVEGVVDGLAYVDRYDEEVAYADREVGRLLEAYRELDLLDDTIVVFTADHGETMIEHERYFSHGYHVWEPIVRVPLLMRVPGEEPLRRSEPVSLVDLVPTLLGLVEAEVPPDLDGHDLRERPADAPLSVEASYGRAEERVQHRALICGLDKYLVTLDARGQVRQSAWIDLRGGRPALPRPVTGEPEELAQLLEWVRSDPDPAGRPLEIQRGRALDGPKVAPGRTAEELEALRSLGYVE